MQHHFIVNPAAGSGQAAKYIPEIEQYFQQKKDAYAIYYTKGIGDIAEYVKHTAVSATEPIRFYACGGDGTFSELIAGIAPFCLSHEADSGCFSVGILPAGTGNDFVRNFESPNFFQNVAAQAEGAVTPIDIIQVGDRYAINMLNIGFDCNAAYAAGELKKKPFIKGSLAYVLGALGQLFHKMGIHLQFTLDDVETLSEEFLLCTIAGGRFCGGGFQSSPKARLTDGLLDVAVIRKISRLSFFRLLPSYRAGTYLEPFSRSGLVTYRQCKNVTVTADTPCNVCIDGEIESFTSLKIQIHPRALPFIVPAGAIMRAQ